MGVTMERTAAWMLELAGGTRVPIRASGLVIGRGPACDVVVAGPEVSRTQAIVFGGADGPSLAILGKGVTTVNGDEVARGRELRVGDRLGLPGFEAVVVPAANAATGVRSTWLVSGPGGNLLGVTRTPFIVGGAATCDLVRPGWPARAFQFHLTDRLAVEALAPITVNGAPLAIGELEGLKAGDRVGLGVAADGDGELLEVVTGGGLGDQSTQGLRRPRGASRVRLEFLARGGRVTLVVDGDETTVYLPDRRCDLIASLLQPPAPYGPGQDIPDEILLRRIWPGKDMIRSDLNVLLHRARHDLVRAGVDGVGLLPRATGGNATRILLAPGATVEVDGGG